MSKPDVTHFYEIRKCLKRCQSMGKHIGWRPDFDRHPLAAAQSNYRVAFEGALEDKDFFTAMCHLYVAASKINIFCDNNRVAEDAGAQYWLENWLWWCDGVVHLNTYLTMTENEIRTLARDKCRCHADDKEVTLAVVAAAEERTRIVREIRRSAAAVDAGVSKPDLWALAQYIEKTLL